jgi:hypothetical protein
MIFEHGIHAEYGSRGGHVERRDGIVKKHPGLSRGGRCESNAEALATSGRSVDGLTLIKAIGKDDSSCRTKVMPLISK